MESPTVKSQGQYIFWHATVYWIYFDLLPKNASNFICSKAAPKSLLRMRTVELAIYLLFSRSIWEEHGKINRLTTFWPTPLVSLWCWTGSFHCNMILNWMKPTRWTSPLHPFSNQPLVWLRDAWQSVLQVLESHTPKFPHEFHMPEYFAPIQMWNGLAQVILRKLMGQGPVLMGSGSGTFQQCFSVAFLASYCLFPLLMLCQRERSYYQLQPNIWPSSFTESWVNGLLAYGIKEEGCALIDYIYFWNPQKMWQEAMVPLEEFFGNV